MSACEMGSVNFTAFWFAGVVSGIHETYGAAHPYVALAVCLTGTLMNIVTVIVLTRPSMHSPINFLLCAVALCDILVMTFLLIFVTHFQIIAGSRCDPNDFNQNWAWFLYVHAQATVILHATSIWLTVALALIRVYTIKRATEAHTDAFTTSRTIYTALFTLTLVVIANIPNLMTFEIVKQPAHNFCDISDDPEFLDYNETEENYLYHVITTEENCDLLTTAYWLTGICFKVVPCFMLTYSIIALLRIIKNVSNRRKTLAKIMNKQKMPRDHTTPMLVAVLLIFLLTELPQGIIHVCNAIFTKETFFRTIYLPLGDIMDLLSLVNSAVNFLIYCAMSRKFRCVFLQLFINFIPEHLYKKYLQDWSGMKDLEISRHKPSGLTDLTRTEQLALTSHRVSTTSTLIRTASKENLCQPKVYSGNLLSVGPPPGRRISSAKVSFDLKGKEAFDGRSSLEIHEIHLPIRNHNNSYKSQPNRLATFRNWFQSLYHSPQNSPQRRMNILQCETSTAY